MARYVAWFGHYGFGPEESIEGDFDEVALFLDRVQRENGVADPVPFTEDAIAQNGGRMMAYVYDLFGDMLELGVEEVGDE